MQQLELSVVRRPLSEKLRRAAWQLMWHALGMWGPRSFSSLRVALLRAFGARVGRSCLICSGVKVLMPWNLEIGDFVAIAEGVDIYNFASVTIGNQSCISQRVWLCTGTHDYRQSSFPLVSQSITIGSSVWIAAEAFLHPGTIVPAGAVIGARCVASGRLHGWTVYAGNPARAIKSRSISDEAVSSSDPVSNSSSDSDRSLSKSLFDKSFNADDETH